MIIGELVLNLLLAITVYKINWKKKSDLVSCFSWFIKECLIEVKIVNNNYLINVQ
jgi:hypothetical protein